MANLLRLILCVTVAYGALGEEEMNALLDDSCEGEGTLSLLQTLCPNPLGCWDRWARGAMLHLSPIQGSIDMY